VARKKKIDFNKLLVPTTPLDPLPLATAVEEYLLTMHRHLQQGTLQFSFASEGEARLVARLLGVIEAECDKLLTISREKD
jgi:hypothetical protein